MLAHLRKTGKMQRMEIQNSWILILYIYIPLSEEK